MKSKYSGYKNKVFWKEISNSYRAMISRCYSINNCKYKRYGERGIIVCEEWKNKQNGKINFYEWAIKNGYSKGLTIDRIDNNGNYEPNNCRWADAYVQANNKSNNSIILYNGQKKTFHELSREFNIDYSVLRYRLTHGWDIETALNTKPILGRNQFS